MLRALDLSHQYPDLPRKLTLGFPIGNLRPLSSSFVPPNHHNISDYHDAIHEYINDELRLRRVSGPFTSEQLFSKIGPFRSSPFQIVIKLLSVLLPRFVSVVIYLTKDLHISINDQISSDDFPTRWGSAEITASIIAWAPPGTQAASLDIEAAYRSIPILPDHKRFLVVMFNDQLFLDHVLPFGLSPASGLQDDFNIFRSPSASGSFLGICDGEVFRYDYDLDHAKAAISLGVPWHKEKGQPFRDSVEYLGSCGMFLANSLL